MPLVKRRFYVKCNGDECIKLYELLKDRTPATEYVEFEITGNGLIIYIYGYDNIAKKIWHNIRDLVGTFGTVTPRKGLYRFSIEHLQKISGKTVSPQILVKVLEKTSRFASYNHESGELITNAPLEEIVNLIRQISEYMERISSPLRGTATKYYLTVCGVITGLSPEEVLERSQELGILINDNGLWRINIEWKKAVDIFLKSLMN